MCLTARGAREVLYRLGQHWPTSRLLWADSPFGGGDLAGWVVVRRWVVERSFAHLDRSRRLSRDYEARAKHSGSQVYLASIGRLVRHIAALSKAA